MEIPYLPIYLPNVYLPEDHPKYEVISCFSPSGKKPMEKKAIEIVFGSSSQYDANIKFADWIEAYEAHLYNLKETLVIFKMLEDEKAIRNCETLEHAISLLYNSDDKEKVKMAIEIFKYRISDSDGEANVVELYFNQCSQAAIIQGCLDYVKKVTTDLDHSKTVEEIWEILKKKD